MNKVNIFIVASPLQLLNCIEAANYFKTKNNILIFLINSDISNEKQMKKLLNISKWNKILYIVLPQTNLDRIFFPYKIQKKLLKYKQSFIEKLFVGEFRSEHIIHIANYLNAQKAYLVDDGLAMLSYNEIITQKSNREKIRKIIYSCFGYKLEIIDFTFFTIFDLNKDNIVKNNFSYIKQSINTKKIESTVYFIGQPLVELSMISKANFKNKLKKIINYYESKSFIFILHRRQNEQLIKELSIELDFSYKRFDHLIELEMLNSAVIPSDFATFYSTAIMTLPKILSDCAYKAFKIKPDKFNKNFTDYSAIEKCYIEFLDNDIEVVIL